MTTIPSNDDTNSPSDADLHQRERTLLTALLLSAWGPFTTGAAVIVSRSTTQLADFVRRTIDLVALYVSWWLFRYLRRHPDTTEARRLQLERWATFTVGTALFTTGGAMLLLFIARLSHFVPGGNVWLGLAIATAGASVNGFFWWRYHRFVAERHDTIVRNQVNLYRAKTLVDVVVVAALGFVGWRPLHPLTRFIDLGGSLAIALYLGVSGIKRYKEASTMMPKTKNRPAPG